MQPLKKTHLCVLKKYLAVAALSCAASVISVKSIAATKNLDIHLTAEVPKKEFKLEAERIELTMTADTTNEIFKGETYIKYLNAENVPSLKVKLVNDTPELKLVGAVDTIGIESILINDKELVDGSEVDFGLASFPYSEIPLKIISKSYKEAKEGTYEGTVTLQFDANM